MAKRKISKKEELAYKLLQEQTRGRELALTGLNMIGKVLISDKQAITDTNTLVTIVVLLLILHN